MSPGVDVFFTCPGPCAPGFLLVWPLYPGCRGMMERWDNALQGQQHGEMFRMDKKESPMWMTLLLVAVVPPGIEPGTQGFSVLCSTNWAMAPMSLLFKSECKGTAFFPIMQIFSYFSCIKCSCFRFLPYLYSRKSGFSAVGSAQKVHVS